MQQKDSGLREDSATTRARVQRDMDKFLGHSALDLRQKVAVACRILAHAEHTQGLAGQVTARADEETFWTTNFTLGFREIRASNLLRIDRQMRIVEGDGMPNPAVRFHLWIYDRRTDVRSVVHTHPPHASALAMIGEPLRIAHMDAMMLHDDCAYLAEWPGVPIANVEGEIISTALGEKSAILLAHHGLLTAHESIEGAVYLATALEHAARLQLLASASGEILVPPAHLAAEAHEFLNRRSIVNATYNYWARQAIAADEAVLD